eukprot:GFUD01068911.1.p1 GENE.GFUD01068911.1~~GFUD01068911.1.p1  ORF type:complete len:570 (+),score=169.02 GFUD01068911.1:138-1847(+)
MLNMSDIWSRAWCETQQIHNFDLKGIIPINEVRGAPNYIPRVNSNPTQYSSRSPSPEPEGSLCFKFKKKSKMKTKTSLVLRKPKNVLEKVPNFKSPESNPPSPTPSLQTPPASPGQMRVLRRPSLTPSTVSSGYQYSDNTSISTGPAGPRREEAAADKTKLPDVVANSPMARTNKNNTKTVTETIQHNPAPIRNCAYTNNKRDNISVIYADGENRTNLQELEAENQRLKKILKVNAISLPNKLKVITNFKATIDDHRISEEKEHKSFPNQDKSCHETKKHILSINSPLKELHIDTLHVDRKTVNAEKSGLKTETCKQVETVARKKTVQRSETKQVEIETDKGCCPMPHISLKKNIQGSTTSTPALESRRMSKNIQVLAPSTPALNTRRMSKNIQGPTPSSTALNSRRISKSNTSNIKLSASSGSIKNIPHSLNEDADNKSHKMKSSKHSSDKDNLTDKNVQQITNHTGYVFLGSGGQVLAECKGHSSQVIVKNVRSSVFGREMLPAVVETVSDPSNSDEEFDVDKILAWQKLREISAMMEKSENANSFTEMSNYPCNILDHDEGSDVWF